MTQTQDGRLYRKPPQKAPVIPIGVQGICGRTRFSTSSGYPRRVGIDLGQKNPLRLSSYVSFRALQLGFKAWFGLDQIAQLPP